MAGGSDTRDAAETSWPNWEWQHVEEGGVDNRRTSWDFAKGYQPGGAAAAAAYFQVDMHPMGR